MRIYAVTYTTGYAGTLTIESANHSHFFRNKKDALAEYKRLERSSFVNQLFEIERYDFNTNKDDIIELLELVIAAHP